MSTSHAARSAVLQDAVRRIRAWGEERDWCGFDPYDALTSPLASALTLGRPLGRRLLTQVVKNAPLNLRPLLRVPQAHEPKAIGLVLSSYAHLAAGGDDHARREADRWAAWLLASSSPSWPGCGWGYHFDVQTRVFFYPAGTPNTIATTFVAHALLDHAEACGSDQSALAAMRAAEFLLAVMGRRVSGSFYFGYVPGERELVHNANVLACSVLARVGVSTGEERLIEVADSALRVTLDAQRSDGSWPYASSHTWVDNFHTAYVLDGLAACDIAGIDVREPLKTGVEYWERELFLGDLTPKYYPNRLYPIDAHCYAQAIETWASVDSICEGSLGKAVQAGVLLTERMLDESGYVWFQTHRRWTNKVPLIRWTTAPSFRALTRLCRLLNTRDGKGEVSS